MSRIEAVKAVVQMAEEVPVLAKFTDEVLSAMKLSGEHFEIGKQFQPGDTYRFVAHNSNGSFFRVNGHPTQIRNATKGDSRMFGKVPLGPDGKNFYNTPYSERSAPLQDLVADARIKDSAKGYFGNGKKLVFSPHYAELGQTGKKDALGTLGKATGLAGEGIAASRAAGLAGRPSAEIEAMFRLDSINARKIVPKLFAPIGKAVPEVNVMDSINPITQIRVRKK